MGVALGIGVAATRGRVDVLDWATTPIENNPKLKAITRSFFIETNSPGRRSFTLGKASF